MNSIDHAIERFREKFPHGVYHLHISNGKITNDPDDRRKKGIVVSMSEEVEKLIRQTLTDFAQEVEEKVIGEDEENFIKEGPNAGIDIYISGKNGLRRQQRQTLHHLIGETGEK